MKYGITRLLANSEKLKKLLPELKNELGKGYFCSLVDKNGQIYQKDGTAFFYFDPIGTGKRGAKINISSHSFFKRYAEKNNLKLKMDEMDCYKIKHLRTSDKMFDSISNVQVFYPQKEYYHIFHILDNHYKVKEEQAMRLLDNIFYTKHGDYFKKSFISFEREDFDYNYYLKQQELDNQNEQEIEVENNDYDEI